MERTEVYNGLISVKKREGHTCSFCLSIILIISMLLQFYLPVFFETEETFFGGYIFPLLSVVIFFSEILFLSLRNIRISYSILGMGFAAACSMFLSVLVTDSGIEKTFGLMSILLGLFVFYKEPLRDRERSTIFLLFAVAIVLILLNGVRGDAYLDLAEGKFNPNTCAFMLTVLFCVSLTRLFVTRSWQDGIVAAICFLLQFFYLSRTALFGELFFVVGSLLFRAWKKNTFSSRAVFWMVLLFSVLGVVLAWLYAEVLFPAIGRGRIVIFGKDLFTGRETIWGFAFDSIREHFWFGVGGHLNEAQYEAGFSKVVMEAHNQAVGMLASFGVLAFVVFYVAFAFFAARPYRNQSNAKTSRLPAIFLVTITFMSYFEIYLFARYEWIAILIAYALIFATSVSEGNR